MVDRQRRGNAAPDPGYHNGLTFFPGSVPLYKNGDDVSTQFPMDIIEQMGLLKMDFLGLKTLTLIDHAAGARFNPRPYIGNMLIHLIECHALQTDHLIQLPKAERQTQHVVAARAHHITRVNLRNFKSDHTGVGLIASLSKVEQRVSQCQLRIIDIVLFIMIEITGMRAGFINLPLGRGVRP